MCSSVNRLGRNYRANVFSCTSLFIPLFLHSSCFVFCFSLTLSGDQTHCGWYEVTRSRCTSRSRLFTPSWCLAGVAINVPSQRYSWVGRVVGGLLYTVRDLCLSLPALPLIYTSSPIWPQSVTPPSCFQHVILHYHCVQTEQ